MVDITLQNKPTIRATRKQLKTGEASSAPEGKAVHAILAVPVVSFRIR